ncbi:MAG: heavy metal translocating P-type ATPase [Gammaproteobacteria bacterium]|jgi:Cd2+/Zn2+-exporting ATPase|nr:heavy metal translocating P-type ATPase [Gammaproteobacteria bacterium]
MNQTVGSAAVANVRQVKIAGMDCGSCAMTIENSMRQLPGVEDVSVSFTTETMDLAGNVALEDVESRLRELGYRLATAGDAQPAAPTEQRGLGGFLTFMWQQPALRTAVFVAVGALLGVILIPALGLPGVGGIDALSLLFGAGVVVAGAPVFSKGIRALVFARRITIDLLMAIAAAGALAIGATGEAITVILLFMLGEALEAYSAERARDSLRSLMALQPQEATVLQAHGSEHNDACDGHDEHDHRPHADGHDEHAHEKHADHDHGAHGSGHDHAAHDHQVVKAVAEVRVGDRVLIRPGQRVPVDGEIIKGISSINQAPVTGEDIPVVKAVGDAVLAGTVNGEAALEVRVTRPAAEGTIARIARLVEQAQSQRSPAERFIDRFARYYTPAVVALAVLAVAIPVLLLGQPFLDTADGTRGWLYRGLTLLIIACPCALVISIPVTVVSGLTRLAQLGVLVKSGALLDRLADVRVVAFDKTGTLTHGKPVVAGAHAQYCEHPAEVFDHCEPCDQVIATAAAVERASEHPVAHAIVAAAGAGGRHVQLAQNVEAHPGLGVSGTADCGHKVAVGSSRLFDETLAGWQDIKPYAAAAESAGQTVMYVAHDNKVIGYIGVQDEIRRDSAAALAALARMTPPVRRVMLTGDNLQSAQRVAAQVQGIDDVRAGLLPADKLSAIESLGADGSAVAMVGDGINDAPALARADIGIAMGGGGTAQAMETADVVLMTDNLAHVALALRMARKSRQIIKQNIALSLGLKLAFLALAVPGLTTLWMAVLADVGATLLVTLNGMRLLRQS